MTKKLLSILALLCMTVSSAWAQTTADIGRVIAKDGKMYKTVTLANKVSTASGVVAYVGTPNIAMSLTSPTYDNKLYIHFCDNDVSSGLTYCSTLSEAIATTTDGATATTKYVQLFDANNGRWYAARAARNYGAARPDGASAWSLPSAAEWNNMLKALAGTSTNLTESSQGAFSKTTVNTKLQEGGTEIDIIHETPYWTATEKDISHVWFIFLNPSGGRMASQAKRPTDPTYVRPIFTFASATNAYVVEYDANNGSGAPSAQSKTHGTALALSSTVPTRDGYTFDGWATSADGAVVYAAGASYTNNADVVLYAHWTQNTASLTDGDDLSALSTYAGKTCTVTYSRSFTADKPSTVCLPFAYATASAGGTFYTFTGITKSGSEYIADMTAYSGANLVANTPYLFKASATGDVDFGGTYAIPADLTAGSTGDDDGWKFVGTYTTQQWTEAPKGIYGFSAQNVDAQGINQGEFVKVGAYVRVKPMRCYLKYKNGGEDYAGARAMTRAAAADEPLPETIKVRLIGADGTVTAIGTLHTRTGEVSFDSEAWYTLDGKRLAGQPTQKGIYVNNGKKVVIK